MINHITLLLFIGLTWGQNSTSIKSKEVNNESITKEYNILNKHNFTIGFLDDRNGFSILGYTRNLKQTSSDEYFIGAGTMIMGISATIGYQYYYIRSKLSISSVFSSQAFIHLGGSGFMPTASLTLDYNLTKRAKIKLGCFGLIHLGGTSSESGSDIGVLPFGGLNFQF